MSEPYRIADFGPSDLLETEKIGTRRIKVEDRHTSFFEAREGRTFHEIELPANGVLVMRATVSVNTILTKGELNVHDGVIKMSIYAGGTDGGTFSSAGWPIINMNAMTTAPDNTLQMLLESGGTYAENGLYVDAYVVASAAGQANSSANVADGQDSNRGIPPNKYYYVFRNPSNNETASGIFHGEWEEYP